MKTINEIKRFASPVALPQSLAWDGKHIWMGSLDTECIYKMDPNSWEVLWQTKAPGLPYGIVAVKNELRVLCGETDEDYRNIRCCLPDQGIDPEFVIPCPEDTGSQLSFDGNNLYVSQWYNRVVLKLDAAGNVIQTFKSPHGICGQVIVGSMLYLMTTEDEEAGDYWITKIDLHDDSQSAEDIARVPFKARALTFDGMYFWSNHREIGETVCFEIPQ